VDYAPPIKYKCGYLPGFKPLVFESDSPELGVPKEFRPTDCVAVTTCEDFPCHQDAYCLVSALGPSCICREGFAGDGKNRCDILRPTPRSLSGMKSTPTIKIIDVGDSCNATMKCNAADSNCHNGRCQCKSGFVQRKKKCVNIDECEEGYPNKCDFNAKCIDRVGTYDCECKDGFRDSNPNNLPGWQCQQTNECLDGTHDCSPDKVCVDRRPPMKWECVERTPAPTQAPTRAPQRAPTIVASPDPWSYGTFYYILYLTQSGVTHTFLLDQGCDVIDNFGLSGCSGNSVKATGTLAGSTSSVTGFSGVATLQIQVAPRSIMEKGCPSLQIGTSCSIDYDWYCDNSWLECPA
jgi:Calcium-binding EGF domain/EB module/EGF-like domain